MLPHPRVQSPAAGSHVDAQFFLRREALPLPAAFAQQKVDQFTKHGGFPSFFLIIHHSGTHVNGVPVNNVEISVYVSNCRGRRLRRPVRKFDLDGQIFCITAAEDVGSGASRAPPPTKINKNLSLPGIRTQKAGKDDSF